MSHKSKMSYPPEVREKAVKLITELGYSVADVAQQLGCSKAAVRRWKAGRVGRRATTAEGWHESRPRRELC